MSRTRCGFSTAGFFPSNESYEVREADFAALTDACDALLSAHTSTVDRVASPWLHVLSEHPNNLDQYANVLAASLSPPVQSSPVRRAIRFAGKLLRWIMAPAFNRELDRELEARQLPERVDALIISHLVSADADPLSTDFYFGSLPEKLAAQGLSCLVVLHDHVQRAGVRRRFAWRAGSPRSAPLLFPRRLSFGAESRLVRRARTAAKCLRDEDRTATQSRGIVAAEAARRASSPSAIATLRIHEAIRLICERTKPRALIVTWEGHAWERIAFHAARSVDLSVQCIGYQHTVLFPRSHAVKRALGGNYDPDVLLTLGEITRERILRTGNLSATQVVVYGSHRRAPSSDVRPPDFTRSRCLVIPEGLERECVRLFKFAIEAAVRIPEMTFVFRTHPVLPMSRLLSDHPFLRTLPSNVEVSREAHIALDFSRCSWALYRGSSAVIHATLAGIRPVYVDAPNELAFDPLFALRHWRRSVSSADEFAGLLADDIIGDAVEQRSEWEFAREFCDRYVMEPQFAVVAGILSAPV